MKMELLTKVTDIRLTFSVKEALEIARNPEKGERIREELEAGLRGSGVDPETGMIVGSSLGLQADLGVGQKRLGDGGSGSKEAPTPKKKQQQKKSGSSSSTRKIPCDICGRRFKSSAGMKVHKTRIHGVRETEPEEAYANDESNVDDALGGYQNDDELDKALENLEASEDDYAG